MEKPSEEIRSASKFLPQRHQGQHFVLLYRHLPRKKTVLLINGSIKLHKKASA
jgi:hypothetical protein